MTRRPRPAVTGKEGIENQFSKKDILAQLEAVGNALSKLSSRPDVRTVGDNDNLGPVREPAVRQRDLPRTRRVLPWERCRFPLKSAREVANLVEVAFEVGKTILALRFERAFFGS